jgi:hypothetical protein
MTAKLRQAAKQEIHKYEFDGKTGKLLKKDDINDLRHMKGISEKQFIAQIFSRRDIQGYMHAHYQIVPMLFSHKKIRKVTL